MTPPVLPPVADPQAWAAQTTWWAERHRSRPLLWPAGADWFSNDPLRPTPHTHPNASEVFFVCSGAMKLVVGRDDLVLRAGDYCLVPPDTYHEPLNIGDTDLCVLVVVAPNWRHERLKPDGFADSDFDGRADVVGTGVAGPLPSDERIRSEVLSLAAGAVADFGEDHADHLVYVLEGVATATVEHLSGDLTLHQYVNVSGGTRHRLANRSAEADELRVLSVWTPAAAHG